MFGLAWKGGVYMASFAIWSLTLEARPEHSTSPLKKVKKVKNEYFLTKEVDNIPHKRRRGSQAVRR